MENKQNIKDLINKFYPHAKEKLGFDHPVRVIMRQDAENAQQSLGKTAYYDPAEKLIVLYVTNRHPKDVLRSFSHELVHHAQNCRGELDDLSTDAHYAKDGKGREIEEEAYLQGNLNLRDYEDSIKFEESDQMKSIKEQNELGDILDKLYDGPRDKNKIPLEKPPLKKDWKKDPIGRKQRSDFRKWYTTYGPGSKKKDPSNAMGGMTSPEGPATDDPSLDYQTKAPQTPPASGMRRAMSRKEYKRFYGESPETTQKLLADDDYRKLVGMAVVNKMKKRLKQLDPNAFRKGTGDEFDDSFSTKPFYQSKEKPPRRSVINENKGVNKMKLTKSQLKGLIKSAVKQISEGGMPMKDEPEGEDLNKDGKKGYGKVPAFLEEDPVDEQEALTISPEGAVELPEDVQRFLDDLDAQLTSMEQEDKEMIAKLITRLALEKAGVDVASPELDVDEMHCGGKRDDELEEQEMQPTIKDKKIDIKKEPKDSKDPVVKVATDKRKEDEKKKVANPSLDVKENNETWYNSSLYESLKSKWTK
jgi:hypothetical protein